METPDPGRTPVILLTGFLGAGKTTMLLRWLREAPATGRRLGVIMNEFGVESVDSQLLARPGLPIEQVDGGCLCCADDASIGHAVNRLRRSGLVDYIVVETSGLADPDNVIDVLTDSDLLPHVTLQAVVTVDRRWLVGEARLVHCAVQPVATAVASSRLRGLARGTRQHNPCRHRHERHHCDAPPSSGHAVSSSPRRAEHQLVGRVCHRAAAGADRKSTRLNSSH